MSDGTVTWGELWNETASRIGRPQARWLCEVASGCDADEFLAVLDRPATERGVAHLDAMLARLAAGEPLQYVLGRWGFRHLDLMVDRRVLIPRPETETVVEIALRLARSLPRRSCCVDLGTGSGAIGLSLAAELPSTACTVWLTDHSADALDVARANAAGIGRAAANVRLARGRLVRRACPLSSTVQLAVVVSNPPYVADDDASSSRSSASGSRQARCSPGRWSRRDPRIVAEARRWLRPADGSCWRSARARATGVRLAAARRAR